MAKEDRVVKAVGSFISGNTKSASVNVFEFRGEGKRAVVMMNRREEWGRQQEELRKTKMTQMSEFEFRYVYKDGFRNSKKPFLSPSINIPTIN